ncbi:MAG: DUF4397 domain-containing protein [Actinomycetota bacterium]
MRTPVPSRTRFSLRLLVATAVAALLVPFLALSPASADDGVRIHLIHGIPGVDVDVEAGGANVFEGFSFGDTQDLSALAGATLEGVKVKVAGTDTVAIDGGDITLPAEGNFTVIAHLDAEGTPTLGVFENDATNTAAGEGRLTVRHTAAAPAVDVLAADAVAFANVTNGNGGSLDLAAGTISASVVPTGETEPVVIGPADLTVVEGEHLLVYAVGSLEDGTLNVLTETITGLHTAPAEVNTGNSLPAANGLNATAVALLGALVLASAGGVAVATRRVRA